MLKFLCFSLYVIGKGLSNELSCMQTGLVDLANIFYNTITMKKCFLEIFQVYRSNDYDAP